MQGSLISLEVENFKSFKGKQVIGPFRNFSAIIGPNGSGKSNLMDAISFVLGENAKNLRVKKLADLVHGVNIQDAVSANCKVKMIFQQVDDEAKEKTFQRSLTEFRVDDQKVSFGEYHKELEKINIFIKARNFLVYQGAVEQIAMQNPKEMTQLFEELSKSYELRDDYERLKQEMHAAEAIAQANLTKKKDIVLEMREAKMEQQDAKRFQNLKQDLLEKNKELYLARLFFAEKHKRKIEKELEDLKIQVEEKKKEKTAFEKVLKVKQTAAKQAYRARNEKESQVQEKERILFAAKPKIAEKKQKLEHFRVRLDATQKACDTAKEAFNNHDKQIEATKKSIKAIEEDKSKLEARLAEESKQKGIKLNDDDLKDYRRLKAEVEKQCSIIGTDLENKRREVEAAKSANEFDTRRLEQTKEKLKQKEKVKGTDQKSLDDLRLKEKEIQESLATAKKKLDELQKEVATSKETRQKKEDEFNKISKEIADAHGDHSETERSRRQHEAVENLKRVFADKVYGRLVDLCKPSNKKYNLAVTKVLGKHMMSIVCDTAETGRECISYLREQHFQPETFLPVSELRVEPFREHLRTLKEPPGVKLIFDVINPNTSSDASLNSKIKKALQFVCGNSLVCEQPKHAREIAYGITRKSERYRAVALDGTQFQPNGVISGGTSDLKARAKKWDENAIRLLKQKRDKLQEELRKLHANARRELDVEMARNQIRHSETRLRFTQTEIRKFVDKVEQHERDGEISGGEDIEARIDGRKIVMGELQKEIEKLENDKSKIQDKVFSDFCKRFGIENIREYEQREMRIHEEYEKSISAFTRQLERLKYELEYLRSEDRQANVLKEEKLLESLNKDKKKLKKEFRIMQEEYLKEDDKLKGLREDVKTKRDEAAKADIEVKEAKTQYANMDRELHTIERSLVQKQQERNRRAEKRHSLLHQCKLASINIPLISGSLNRIMLNADLTDSDIVDDSLASLNNSHQHSQSMEAAEGIEIDYSDLRDSVKKLKLDAEINTLLDDLAKSAAETEEKLSKMIAPNTKLDERIDKVKERENENLAKLDEGRKKAQSARRAFEKVKAERLKRFQDFYAPVESRIDDVYKALSQNQSAQAYLSPLNTEEPYLDGISYNCIAPGKRFRPMDNLSGGEKTVAALALLFAIHSSNPSPFFVLDEVDAALDNTNIAKVVHYIRERSQADIQLIVISLKEEMYNKADSLIGIYPKKTDPCIVSGVLTYDLEKFDSMFEGD